MENNNNNFELITLNKKGEEIYGTLFLNGVAVTESGWWRTTDHKEALKRAIDLFNDNN